MDHKKNAVILYNSLNEYNVENKIDIVSNLYKISNSTLYRWINEHKDNQISLNYFYDFNFLNVSKFIVDYIVSYVSNNIIYSLKKIKKSINKIIPNNKLSFKQIATIIDKNSFLPKSNKRTNYKVNNEMQTYVIEQIKENNTLTAKEMVELVKTKFNIKISLTTIYNIFQKNNYTHKRTSVNINPQSFDDQQSQLENVYNHLENNNKSFYNDDHDFKKNKSSKSFYNNHILNINKMNKLLKADIDLLNSQNNNNINCNIINNLTDSFNEFNTINNLITDLGLVNKLSKSDNQLNIVKEINNSNVELNISSNKINLNNELNPIPELNKINTELVSIDEFSIITNRTVKTGWSLSGTDCIINLPYVKQNKRYSLLMATTNKKILKYVLVEGSIRTDIYIQFITDLNNLNRNYTYLIDNASIHCNKKTKLFYKTNKINIVFNAPYQSKFNPIEMVFSLLRKKINKKVVKSELEIRECVDTFIREIDKNVLRNIFNHSTKILKAYIESNKKI